MLIEIKVPQLSESVAEATLLAWHKKVGEAVKRDENLIDVETDKVVLELPAPNDGVLIEITREGGATVTSNDVIGVIDTDAKGAQPAAAKAPSQAPVQPAPTPDAPHTAPEPAKAAEPATAMPELVISSYFALKRYLDLFATVAVLAIALVTVSFQTIKAALANPVDSLRRE